MFVAVDIGGTKTLVAVFDAHGKIIEQQKFPTPKIYDDFKDELAKTVANLSTKDFTTGAIGMPGKIDRKHGASLGSGTNIGWKNTRIAADVEKIFNCPFYVENDANLAGLSEAINLKGKYRKVMYITISTGIGGGFVVDGVLDPESLDSEIGHMLLEHKGKFMTWEKFASGKAIFKKYGKRASDINDAKIWKVIVKDFSAGIINVIAIVVPDVIVIGGGVGTHFHKFGDLLIDNLKKLETPLMPIPPVIGAKHPEEAVIYGCYAFAKQHHDKYTK